MNVYCTLHGHIKGTASASIHIGPVHLEVINPRCTCAARVIIVLGLSVRPSVRLFVCLSVCLSSTTYFATIRAMHSVVVMIQTENIVTLTITSVNKSRVCTCMHSHCKGHIKVSYGISIDTAGLV